MNRIGSRSTRGRGGSSVYIPSTEEARNPVLLGDRFPRRWYGKKRPSIVPAGFLISTSSAFGTTDISLQCCHANTKCGHLEIKRSRWEIQLEHSFKILRCLDTHLNWIGCPLVRVPSPPIVKNFLSTETHRKFVLKATATASSCSRRESPKLISVSGRLD